MKKLMILLMVAALGAATLSCNDQDFSDVEKSVHDENLNFTEDKRDIIAKPGN